jgi:hypothetical protein
MTDVPAGESRARIRAQDRQADDTAARRRNDSRKIGWILGVALTVLLAAAAANLYLTLTRTAAACNFYQDLSGIPVAVSATTGKPSELSVGIVAHAREAFRGSGCAGILPPPAPSFVKWAPYYHLSPE